MRWGLGSWQELEFSLAVTCATRLMQFFAHNDNAVSCFLPAFRSVHCLCQVVACIRKTPYLLIFYFLCIYYFLPKKAQKSSKSMKSREKQICGFADYGLSDGLRLKRASTVTNRCQTCDFGSDSIRHSTCRTSRQ